MTVHIAFGRNVAIRQSHSSPQILDGKHGDEEYIEPGNATSITCPSVGGEGHAIARVFNNSGAAVYVSFGTAPNAATDDVRFMVPDGSVEYFSVAEGDKAAVAAIS